MATPVILVNSATGSDTAASGAGPATALTGSSASTDSGGTVVTLDGSPDLSGVATDGTHVIFLNDGTSGHRHFSKISAVDNSAKTVTVASAFTGSLSGKSWAIGGKRASIGATTSRNLNNGAGGNADMAAGWIIELESGHTETLSSSWFLNRAGDTTSGHCILRGTSGAATRPVLTFSANDWGILMNQSYQQVLDIEIVNSNGTKTSGAGIGAGNAAVACVIRRCKVSSCYRGIYTTSNAHVEIYDTECESNAGPGISLGYGAGVYRCYIHDNGARGIEQTAQPIPSVDVIHCIVESNTGYGIYVSPSASGSLEKTRIAHNVVYNNSSDGIRINVSASTMSAARLIAEQNICVNNGAYGIIVSSAGALAMQGSTFDRNAFYNNTSGAISPSGIDTNTVTLTGDPFANAASGDFSLNDTAGAGADCRAAGSPGTFPGGLTVGYLDLGAVQHEDGGGGGGGGGGLLTHPGMTGGMRG